ncbi:uncharacterized protein BJ171DRAFT_190901 [Polychytrium aggregatum]|uniref:uncharacterized protein n=1 Tax=Polychytrium aggregatum TaxID=110093 RepID=UPI0022FF08FC|nr:uncharacterized protein BJ171DRAFT_190901 [Polychytrium aggregatum]KAI9202087.1 hypothetical protein BJ171DRAFT_190901 [Polychytrium aggregatum]
MSFNADGSMSQESQDAFNSIRETYQTYFSDVEHIALTSGPAKPSTKGKPQSRSAALGSSTDEAEESIAPLSSSRAALGSLGAFSDAKRSRTHLGSLGSLSNLQKAPSQSLSNLQRATSQSQSNLQKTTSMSQSNLSRNALTGSSSNLRGPVLGPQGLDGYYARQGRNALQGDDKSVDATASESMSVRSFSPIQDMTAAMDKMERQIEKSLQMAEENLHQSMDNIVRTKIASKTGSRQILASSTDHPGGLTRSRTAVNSSDSRPGTGAQGLKSSKGSLARLDSTASNRKLFAARGSIGSFDSVASGRLPAIESRPARAPERRSIDMGKAQSKERIGQSEGSLNDLSKSGSRDNVVARLTDPANFPPAYKHKFEAIRKHQEKVAEMAQYPPTSPSGSRESLSKHAAPESDVVKRLTDPKNFTGIHRLNPSDKLDFNGYPLSFKPPSENEKEKIRTSTTKPKIEFFNEFAPPSTERTPRSSVGTLSTGNSTRASRTTQ